MHIYLCNLISFALMDSFCLIEFRLSDHTLHKQIAKLKDYAKTDKALISSMQRGVGH